MSLQRRVRLGKDRVAWAARPSACSDGFGGDESRLGPACCVNRSSSIDRSTGAGAGKGNEKRGVTRPRGGSATESGSGRQGFRPTDDRASRADAGGPGRSRGPFMHFKYPVRASKVASASFGWESCARTCRVCVVGGRMTDRTSSEAAGFGGIKTTWDSIQDSIGLRQQLT